MVSKEALGQKIKKMRKDRCYSQEKFSELIDISPRHLINIEMGYTYPSMETLQKISSVLKIPAKLFFEDEDLDIYYDKYELIKSRLREKINTISENNLRILSVIIDNMQ